MIVIVVGAVLFASGASLIGFDYWSAKRASNTLSLKGKIAPAPIGYKRAVLALDSHAFRGVTDVSSPYSCDEVRADKTPGFYSYYEVEKAVKHPQRGTVYLETLAHGEIQHHELGMTSEKQRVLQVLLGDCTECGTRQAEYWVQKPLVSDENAADRFIFACSTCSNIYRDVRDLKDLEHALLPYCAKGQTVVVGTLKPSSWGREFVPSEVGK